MKILVTGAKGMLAHDLIPVLREGHEVISPAEENLDITKRAGIYEVVEQTVPDLVVNCAAYTQVDKAEEERDKAFLVNGIGVQNIALACHDNGIPLCHISTDYVFDGEKKSPYTPFDNTNPINAYGESKLAGEKYIQWVDQRLRQPLGGGGEQNAVEWRARRHPGQAVADHDLDIVVTERPQTHACLFGQRPITLNAHHFTRQP